MSLLGSITAIAVTLAAPTLCKSFITNLSLRSDKSKTTSFLFIFFVLFNVTLNFNNPSS